MIEVIPFGDRLLIELEPKESEIKLNTIKDEMGREFSLQLPDSATQRSRIGIVRKAGEACKYFKEGDLILISWYTGIILHIASMRWINDKIRMCREEEILGKVIKKEG